jgi:hypothetical protein
MNRTLKASLLFSILLVWALAFLVAHHFERSLPAPAPHDLFAIVNGQLAAFRSADFQTAYRHAATGVQQKFTLPQFEKMVRKNYPAVATSQRVEFGLVKVQGATALVQVFFVAHDRSVRCFLYSLTHEEGGWKIDGVEELERFRAGDRLAGTVA